ncbi:MAG: SGNH/GDSL hydrolase family protein [Cellulosilyticaceae bacterium]
MLIEKNSTWIMIGDSVTDCGRKQPEGEDISCFSGPWGNGYVELVRGYLGAFHPGVGVRVINKGTSGHQAKDLVARWEEDVLAYKPEWVSIMIGINDVWRVFDAPHIKSLHGNVTDYEKYMREMIERTLPITKNIIVMTPYFIESNLVDPMRQEMDAYGRVCTRLAKEYQLYFVDTQAAFDKVLEDTHPMTICWDRIHPNVIGHTLLAHKILEVIEAK